MQVSGLGNQVVKPEIKYGKDKPTNHSELDQLEWYHLSVKT